MRKGWLLIIVPAVIWALHAWISDDGPSDTGKELACEPESPQQVSARAPSARGGGYPGNTGSAQPREQQAPPFRTEYAPQAASPPGVVSRFSGGVTDPMALQGYRFRSSSRGAKTEPPAAPPVYSGSQFGGTSPPAYSRQQSARTSPPVYSGQQFGSPYPPAYTGQQYPPPSPADPGESGFPRYGARDPVAAAPPVQMRFRPLEKSKRSSRRWTGNYPPPRQGASPESYGQWAVPRTYDGSRPKSWTPPSRSNLFLHNGLGAQDVYSSR